MELAIIVGKKVKQVASSFLSTYLNFYMVVTKNNKLKANEGTALAKTFARNMTQRLIQAPKVAENNESDVNEGKALAQIFRANARPND